MINHEDDEQESNQDYSGQMNVTFWKYNVNDGPTQGSFTFVQEHWIQPNQFDQRVQEIELGLTDLDYGKVNTCVDSSDCVKRLREHLHYI